MARAFLTPDEVATLGSEVSVVFMKGTRPILLKKPTYYEDKRWAGLWDPNTFETGG
jgi:type IV secretory pathway TraG/TraD family ATPase VirD4